MTVEEAQRGTACSLPTVAPMAIENVSLRHVNKFSAYALDSRTRLTLCGGSSSFSLLKEQRSEIPLCEAVLDASQRQLTTLDERMHALQERRQRIMDYLDASYEAR